MLQVVALLRLDVTLSSLPLGRNYYIAMAHEQVWLCRIDTRYEQYMQDRTAGVTPCRGYCSRVEPLGDKRMDDVQHDSALTMVYSNLHSELIHQLQKVSFPLHSLFVSEPTRSPKRRGRCGYE